MQALSLGDGQFYTFNVSTKKSDVMVIEQTGDCLETKPLSTRHHRGMGVQKANTELCIQLPGSLKNNARDNFNPTESNTSSYGPSTVVRGGSCGSQDAACRGGVG